MLIGAAAEPGVLLLQFLLHLAGGHWVACRGMQGGPDDDDGHVIHVNA